MCVIYGFAVPTSMLLLDTCRHVLVFDKYEWPGIISSECLFQLSLQEFAANVLKELLGTVQYTSTDMVMKEEDFVNISLKVVSAEVLSLVEISLANESKIQKQQTEMGYCIVKFAPSGDNLRPASISEVDVGIVR